jgi:hypothetical protein
MPDIKRDASPDDVIAMIVDAADHHTRAKQREEYWFKVAVDGLVNLHAATASGRAPSPDALTLFTTTFTRLLLSDPIAMNLYNLSVDNYALRAADDGWYFASIGRSALQYILDDFAGTELVGLIEPDYLTDIDDELREAAPRVKPLGADWIPPGIPRSHWWWWAPGSSVSDDVVVS